MKSFFKFTLTIIFVVLIFLITFLFIKQSSFKDPEPTENRKIIIVNKSNQIIYWLLSDYGNFNRYIDEYVCDSISQNKHDSIYCNGWSWEAVAENSKNKRICIFIIVQDSINKYSLDGILKKQNYTKKILVDVNYLNTNNWTIEYP